MRKLSPAESFELACRHRKPTYWAVQSKIIVNKKPFNLYDHPYVALPMDTFAKITVKKWAAQMGKTFGPNVLKKVHHLIYGYYPQGAMFVFPNQTLVDRFSKSRFTPLMDDNPFLSRYIKNTDTIELKRIGQANLYFVGGKATEKIGGEQKSSAALKSEPVDSLDFEEVDNIDQDMIVLAMDRIGHSEIKDISYTGTPSIPDFGIDKFYTDSTQHVWMIKCEHCGAHTCLEQEFPECIKETKDGRFFRACIKCGREIFTKNGDWVASYPDREAQGTWIGKCNLADKYVDLKKLLERYENPPNGNKALVMNGDHGVAWIEAENKLTRPDLLNILGQDPMWERHPGPTAMGVDVGNDFHISIVDKPYDKALRLVKACHLGSKGMKDFSPLRDLVQRFNTKCLVIDFAPAQKKVRDFRQALQGTGCEVYGNIYQDKQRGAVNWDSKEGIVRENRTEVCDATHDLVVQPGRLLLPRMSSEMDNFIKHMCNIAKTLEEDHETGSKEYRYRKLGPDHYRHSVNYAYLAASRIAIYVPKKEIQRRRDGWDSENQTKSKSWMAS